MIANHQSKFRGHLQPGENILWTGIPKRGIVFRSSDLFMIPFSLFWCGFAIFWTVAASSSGGLFGLFGVPFICVGLMLVFGRFITDALRRKNTVYGITEERIIIKSGVFSKSMRSLNLATLSDIELVEKNDGTGSVMLGPQVLGHHSKRNADWTGVGQNMPPQLELIPNARNVYQQIINLQKDIEKGGEY